MERTILAVEDSPTQAERLRLLLEEAGYRVIMAANGREGLEIVRSSRPDLIISDVVMPEMDGYAFCRAVKSVEATRRIPFVLLTERKDPANIILGLEKGADNFITKPFEDDQLLDRVRRIFEHLEHRRRGHLEMEVAVHVGGKEIVLSADKQQIIELLFATFEDLGRVNTQLAESQRTIEEYARRLEAMVQERSEQLRSLFEGVPVGLHRTTPDGQILDANPALVQMLGYPDRESLLRVTVPSLYVNREDRRVFRSRIESEGVVRDFEAQFRRRDGTVIWTQANARAVRDEGGRVLHYEGSVQDITERKRAEEEIQRQREALLQREKLAAMGALLAGVAHELNNPLSVVMGQAAMLRRAADSEAPARRAEKIEKAADRCARIVKNFLALARQRPPERSRVGLNQVVEDAVELLAYQLRVDDVEVDLDLGDGLPELWADPHQLHQVVINLVSNARDAMRETAPPRRLTLATRHDPSRARVTLRIADTGPGMPPEVQARIFEPFFTTKPAGQGTGLGLSLCHGIVEGHGGVMHVESQPGQGATFVAELPVETAPPSQPEALSEETLPLVTGKAILVVDDEPDVAGVLAEMLVADGHQVETATSGVRALEKLAERDYDLIVSDIKMPELDGPGLYHEIERRYPRLRRRIIFLTGDTLSAWTDDFLAHTEASSLSKPFVPGEVRRAVQRALRTA